MKANGELLDDFVENGSEAAFRELVGRYIDLVHSTAMRLVNGDAHRAEDVAQMVFTDLARMARNLSKNTMLGGWLHRHTCFVARTVMRGERRRQARERQAREMNDLNAGPEADLAHLAPVLDDAINELGSADRAAIMLRFFEHRDLRSVGAALGSSENAAQKRVSRALEVLRLSLKRRGVSLSVSALGTVLGTKAISAAPTGMALSIAGAALVNAAASGGIAGIFFKIMTLTKLKLGSIFAVAIAGATAVIVLQSQSMARLRDENRMLSDRFQQLNQPQAENLKGAEPGTEPGLLVAQERLRELLRLRGEVNGLKRQLAEAERRSPKSAVSPQVSEDTAEQQRTMAIGKLNYAKGWMLAFFNYADQNGDRFPTNFEQATLFMADQVKDQTNLVPEQFEIVYQGSRTQLIDGWQKYFIIREKEAWPGPNGWNRTYGFADGHSEIHHSDDGDFGPWEEQHLARASEPEQ